MFPPSLPPPPLSAPSPHTKLANCEAVVQHACQPASLQVGLGPIMHNHNRQKGYIQTTDWIVLKLRVDENGRQTLRLQVGEQAKTREESEGGIEKHLVGYLRPYSMRQAQAGNHCCFFGRPHVNALHNPLPFSASLQQTSPRTDSYKRITNNFQLPSLLFYIAGEKDVLFASWPCCVLSSLMACYSV